MDSETNDNSEAKAVIVAIDTGPCGQRLRDGLRDAGFGSVVHFTGIDLVAEAIVEVDPDVIMIDLGNPGDDIFAAALALIRALDRPSAVFVDRSDRARTDAAIEAGVSSYVIDGFKAGRLGGVMDMAIARHQVRQRILFELAAKDRQSADRAIIEQAKASFIFDESRCATLSGKRPLDLESVIS